MNIRRFKPHLSPTTTALTVALLIAGCGNVNTQAPVTPGQQSYILTVRINASSNRTSLEARYSGQMLSFQPEAGFAVLRVNNPPASNDSAVQALEPNNPVEMPELHLTTNPVPLTPENTATAEGWNAWSGGWSAWSSGWNAWSGGWSAWSSGTATVPPLPSENRLQFMQIKLPQAQAITRNFGSGIKVAVIDTGIDTNHPMFTDRLAPSSEWKDFIDNDTNPQEVAPISGTLTGYGHGTGVAGLILQAAPKATILPIRALGPDGSGDVAGVVSAIDWAIQKGANVINLSLGTTTAVTALQTVINTATSQGRYVIASTGNTGDGNITYPARWAKSGSNSKYLISVGSLGPGLTLSLFSCNGVELEQLAPGELMTSAYPGNQTARYTGTSFAAPLVSGAVALALSDTAAANKGNLENYLFASDVPVGSYNLMNTNGFMRQLPDGLRRKALMVVWDPEELDNSDVVLKNRLESIGYIVTLIMDEDATASSATGHDVVLISDSVGSGYVNSKFRNVTVPVVVLENYIYDDMLMTGNKSKTDFDDLSGQTQIAITDSTHPLAAGLSGNQTVYTSSRSVAWGVPSTSAFRVGSVSGDSSRFTIFGYDQGASMVGMTAPARRVGFFFSDSSASAINNQSGQLFEAAITWAVTRN
jgi:subtilisin family serine protease